MYGDRSYQLHVSFKAQVLGKRGITEHNLRLLFQKFGAILDVIIKKHVLDAEKRLGGYAFIQFERDEAAHEAIRVTHNQIIDNIHYNCRWSKKHVNRSGSFDTTVASETPSLSVSNYPHPNHRFGYGHGSMPSAAPCFVPPPTTMSSGFFGMPMISGSYSNDENMMHMMSNAGMMYAPSIDAYGYGNLGANSSGIAENGPEHLNVSRSFSQDPSHPFNQQVHQQLQRPQLPGHAPAFIPPPYHPMQQVGPFFTTGNSAVPILPPIPPAVMPIPSVPNHISGPSAAMYGPYFMNASYSVDSTAYNNPCKDTGKPPGSGGGSTLASEGHHGGGTDTENSPSQQFLTASHLQEYQHQYGQPHNTMPNSNIYMQGREHQPQPSQVYMSNNPYLNSNSNSNNNNNNNNPQNNYFVSSFHPNQQHQHSVMFSPLPASAVSAATFVPRAYVSQAPQQPLQQTSSGEIVNNGQYNVSSQASLQQLPQRESSQPSSVH
jgi:hypothetical protein